MEEYFTFQWRREVAFQMGGFIQVGGGGAPWGALVLMGGFLKKIDGWQVPPTMGNPETLY